MTLLGQKLLARAFGEGTTSSELAVADALVFLLLQLKSDTCISHSRNGFFLALQGAYRLFNTLPSLLY
jgi:hypothetical protein